eukprot:m.57547 g.57547  ORF g.57547 m.57547 type:complete len:155 (-) comp11605_c1_seq2:483-947(-)
MIGLKLGSEVALYSYDWTAEPLLGVLAAPVAPAIALAGCSASGDGSDGSFCFGFCAFGVGLLAGFAFLVGASFSLGSAAANPTTPYSLDTSANVPLSTSSSGSTVLKTSPCALELNHGNMGDVVKLLNVHESLVTDLQPLCWPFEITRLLNIMA